MNALASTFAPGLLVETPAVRVSLLPPVGRLSLRAGGDLAPLNAALGLTLPDRIGTRSEASGVQALRLGPDEWSLQLPPQGVAALVAACAAVYAAHPHSLVDISGREVTLGVEGPRAAELLTLGCPRDIDRLPAGEGRRTVFDGASVVLWRDGPDRFRLDVWNSFAGHLGHLLETGARELATDAA